MSGCVSRKCHQFIMRCNSQFVVLAQLKCVILFVLDVNVKKYLQRAEQKLNQELQKEKAMYRGMFSSNIKSSSGDGVNHSQESGD